MEKNMDMMKFCAGAFQDQNGREHGTLRQRRA